jgi:hypothetical protein
LLACSDFSLSGPSAAAALSITTPCTSSAA